MAPRLRPGTPMQRKPGTDEVRTLTASTPHRPVSQYHAARWWLRHHLDREDDGEWRDESGWGRERQPLRRVRGVDRETRRESARLGVHAQQVRAEATTMGGREETQRFFGGGREQHAGTERRVRVTAQEEAERRYEAEQRLRFETSRRRGRAVVLRAQRGA